MDISNLSNRTIKIWRDAVLFAAGLAGIAYETLIEGGDKPTLLVLFGAMVGLPAFLKADENKKQPPAAPPDSKPATPSPPKE